MVKNIERGIAEVSDSLPKNKEEVPVEEEKEEEDRLAEMGFLDKDVVEIQEEREEVLAEIERLLNDLDKAFLGERDLKRLAMKIAAYQGIDIEKEFPKSILCVNYGTDRSGRE